MFTSIINGALVAALSVASTVTQAQESHIPATTAGITVSGVWLTRDPSSGEVRLSGSNERGTVSLDLATRVPIPAPPAGTPQDVAEMVSGVTSGSTSARTAMRIKLEAAGVGPAASYITSALALLKTGTATAMVEAIKYWNYNLGRTMSVRQMQALLSTPEGVAVVRIMKAAAANYMRAGTQ